MNKKTGLVAVVATLVSVASAAVVLIQQPALSLPRQSEQVAIPKLPDYNPRDLVKFHQHEEKLNSQLYSQRVELSDDAMKIFGYQEKPLKELSLSPDQDIYHLAMVYRSGQHHYALIDEKLYQRGGVLPGGEVIRNINMSGVVIEKGGNTNVLVVGDVTAAPIVAQAPVRKSRSRAPDSTFETAAGAQRQLDSINKALKVLQDSNKVLQQR